VRSYLKKNNPSKLVISDKNDERIATQQVLNQGKEVGIENTCGYRTATSENLEIFSFHSSFFSCNPYLCRLRRRPLD
jgi:hypothetical protein